MQDFGRGNLGHCRLSRVNSDDNHDQFYFSLDPDVKKSGNDLNGSPQIQDLRGGVQLLCRTPQPSLPGPEQQPAGSHPPGGLLRAEPVPAGAQPEPGPLQPLLGDGLGHLSPLELPGDPEGTGPLQQRPRLSTLAHLLPPDQPAAAPAFEQLPGVHPQLHLLRLGAPGGARPDPQRPQDGVRGGPPRAGLATGRYPPPWGEPVHVQVRDRTFCFVAQQVTGTHQRRRGPHVRLPSQHEEHVHARRGDADSGVPPEERRGRPRLADLVRLPGYSPGLCWPHLPFRTLSQPQGHQEADLRHA